MNSRPQFTNFRSSGIIYFRFIGILKGLPIRSDVISTALAVCIGRGGYQFIGHFFSRIIGPKEKFWCAMHFNSKWRTKCCDVLWNTKTPTNTLIEPHRRWYRHFEIPISLRVRGTNRNCWLTPWKKISFGLLLTRWFFSVQHVTYENYLTKLLILGSP